MNIKKILTYLHRDPSDAPIRRILRIKFCHYNLRSLRSVSCGKILLIIALNLNSIAPPAHLPGHCLRPPAAGVTLKASSAGEELLDTLITREPPKYFPEEKKFMWNAAYKAARYFVGVGAVQHPDEIFGLCFQTVMEADAKRSRVSDKKPLGEFSDWQLTRYIIGSVASTLRKEDSVLAISSAEARDRITRAINWTELDQAQVDEKDFIEQVLAERPELLALLGVERIDDLAPEEISARLRMLAILSRLKGKYRDVFYLLYLENRSRDEAAFILNCSFQRIGQINKKAAKISRKINYLRIHYMPERFLSIEEIRKRVYEKYRDRLKIAGSYEDSIRARTAQMQPSTPEEDLRLFEEAIRSFPEGTEIEAKIARMFFLKGESEAEIEKGLSLSTHQYRMKAFSACVYLDYYLQGKGVLGFIVRKSKFIPRQEVNFLEFACLCYKHNTPVAYAKSCVVYDELRNESIDLSRLNNLDNYRDMPDGYAHIARDLRLAKEKGILRPGLPYIYYLGIGQSPSTYWLYMLAKEHGLTSKFSYKMTGIGEVKYFKVLKELKEKPGLYRRPAGLAGLAEKYKIRPETIWAFFDRNFRKEMGWGSLRHRRLQDATETLPTKPKSASAGTEFLDTLITKEPPENFNPKQRFMHKAAYKAARYFVGVGAAQYPDEIFGLCFQAAMEIDAKRSKSSMIEPMEELAEGALTRGIINYVIGKLRAENRISEPLTTLDKIAKAIEKIRLSGGELSFSAIAGESGVDIALLQPYLRLALVSRGYGAVPDQAQYEGKEFFEELLAERPELLALLGVERIDDLAPEEISARLRTLAILSRLKGEHRDVLYLLYLENRSREEVAFILNHTHQRISQIEAKAAEISRRIDFSRIQYMPERLLSIKEIRKELYEKYKERLKILGSYEDKIRAKSAQMQPSTPEEDLRLFEEAVESFPEGTETEKRIARMLYLEGKRGQPEIQKELKLTLNELTRKVFSSRVYLDYYLQGRGVIGYIVRRAGFTKRPISGFSEAVCLCYKHNIPIVDTESRMVYDELRDETIDLARLNNLDNYRDMPDGYAHIARDLRLAKEKGILRPGLAYIYWTQKKAVSPYGANICRLIRGHGLANKFLAYRTKDITEEKYFGILRELKDRPDSYRGVAGLRRLAKKYKIRPEAIWFCFDRNVRKEMGWGRMRHGRLPDGSGKVPDPGRILKAITAAA